MNSKLLHEQNVAKKNAHKIELAFHLEDYKHKATRPLRFHGARNVLRGIYLQRCACKEQFATNQRKETTKNHFQMIFI